jgi:tRNA(fMet)-specific endonuclease VapC
VYILDTDTLTHLHAGHPRVIQHLREVDDPDVVITLITKIEILRGRFDFVLKAASGVELLRAQGLLTRTEDLLAQISVIPFNDLVSVQFERLQKTNRLRKIGRADLLIASTALAYRATLATRNVRHFHQIPNLKVVNWVDYCSL